MMPDSRLSKSDNTFDEHAADYDGALDQGISVSGENKEFFSRSRVAWLGRCLQDIGERPKRIMDYGCGTGSALPYLLGFGPGISIIGVDTSARCLDVARRTVGSAEASFFLPDQYEPNENLDLVFSNGVFHHILPAARGSAVRYIRRSLRPGGCFAFWENNPWNPGTRYVMSRIPFDRDAIPVSVLEAHRLLRSEGFSIVRTHFLFVFPRVLRWFRPLEPGLSKLPLGAQYQVLCRKS
jgi:SAM-dependent methyltransferase